MKEQLGLRDPNKVYAILKNRKKGDGPFVFPDGTILESADFLDPPRTGRKIVIMGDTCTGKHIAPMAQDADIIVHEATNAYFKSLDSSRYRDYNALERDTLRHGHSTPQMAGRFAAQINAKRLILTHFSPRYRGDEELQYMKGMYS